MKKRLLFLSLILFLMGLAIAVYHPFSPGSAVKPSLWLHRAQDTPKDSDIFTNLEIAGREGYEGVEIDVYFREGEFFIGHDPSGSKKVGPEVRLEKVLDTFGNRFAYWIDLKNLSGANVADCVKSSKHLISRFGIKTLYIENSQKTLLRDFVASGIKTILWLHDFGHISMIRTKLFLLFSPTDAVSISENRLGKRNFYRYLKNFPIFTFTVNSVKRAEAILGDPSIRVLLTDKIKPGEIRIKD